MIETGRFDEHPHVDIAEWTRFPLYLRAKDVGQLHGISGRKEAPKTLPDGVN